MSTEIEAVEERAGWYLFERYGDAFSIQDIEHRGDVDAWSATVKTDIPHLCRDDRHDEVDVKFVTHQGLGEVVLDAELGLDESSSINPEDLRENLRMKRRMWEKQVKQIVVSSTARNLVKITQVRQSLTPVRDLAGHFYTEPELRDEELRKEYRGEDYRKQVKYINLMKGLNLVKETENGYTYGDLFAEYQKETKTPEELMDRVAALVIQERYGALKEVFGITTIDPYLDAEYAYYRPSFEDGKLLHMLKNRLVGEIKRASSDARLKIKRRVEELENVDALRERNGYVIGNEELFSDMLRRKKEMTTSVRV